MSTAAAAKQRASMTMTQAMQTTRITGNAPQVAEMVLPYWDLINDLLAVKSAERRRARGALRRGLTPAHVRSVPRERRLAQPAAEGREPRRVVRTAPRGPNSN